MTALKTTIFFTTASLLRLISRCSRHSLTAASAICAILLVFSGLSTAQELQTEALLKRGLALFQQGKYVSARLDFNEIITRYPRDERASAAYVMLAKTFYRLGDYDSAVNTIEAFRDAHPESRYMEWSDYMVAACRYRTGDVESAVKLLAELASETQDESMRNHALGALRFAILPTADSDKVFGILKDYDIGRSEVENAEQPEVAADISPISPAADWIPQSSIKIGLLAPLTGVSSQEGNDLLRGVSAALTNYSVINGKPVELVVEDTESDLIQSVLKTRNLIDKGVIAIIGPVYGESTITSALESNAHGIPFIAPTAPDVGIPSLGEYVFQINNTPIMQAEELARFSSDSLGFTNAVIISSNDWWGKAVTETFTAEFEQRGGKILCTEEFEQGVNRYNYNDILMRIRSTAPESDAIPDSMMVFDYGNAFPDTVIVKPDPKTTPQRLKPVTSIDCILVSALPEEAVNIVRQIRDYHIDAVILGDSGWSDESVAAELGHYGEGAYLVMTSTESGGAAGSQYFSDNFRARNAELHTITSRKGYDACAILIHCLAQGAADPLSLKQRLENVRDFGGLTSRYTIDPERRINTALDFVQIQNGRLVRIQRIGMQDDDGISPEQRL